MCGRGGAEAALSEVKKEVQSQYIEPVRGTHRQLDRADGIRALGCHRAGVGGGQGVAEADENCTQPNFCCFVSSVGAQKTLIAILLALSGLVTVLADFIKEGH